MLTSVAKGIEDGGRRVSLESMKDTKPLSCLEEASQEQGLAQESEKWQSNAGITNWVASDEETPYLR